MHSPRCIRFYSILSDEGIFSGRWNGSVDAAVLVVENLAWRSKQVAHYTSTFILRVINKMMY